MFLGNKLLEAGFATGEIICDPPAKNYNMGIDLHLDRHFWVMRDAGIRYMDIRDNPKLYYEYVENDHVVLPPTSVTLAATVERIGSTGPCIISLLNTRSTIARWGIAIHTGSIFTYPGHVHKWTLELINTTNKYIRVPAGITIGTTLFAFVVHHDDVYEGNYAGEWTPEMMLPKQNNLWT